MSSPKSKRGIVYDTWTNTIDYGAIEINISYKKISLSYKNKMKKAQK